jgi:hypothetical protein
MTGGGGGGTVFGVGVTRGAGGGAVVGIGAVEGGVAGGGFATVAGEAALFTWLMGGRLTVTAREPEDRANARPIPAAATRAITARMIPSRLLMVGSFDSVVGSENPTRRIAGWDLLFGSYAHERGRDQKSRRVFLAPEQTEDQIRS